MGHPLKRRQSWPSVSKRCCFQEEGRNLQEELRELGHAMDTVESIRLELEEMTEGSWRR